MINGIEELNPFILFEFTVRKVKWYSSHGKQFKDVSKVKLKIELFFGPVIPFLRPKDLKSRSQFYISICNSQYMEMIQVILLAFTVILLFLLFLKSFITPACTQ